MIKSTKYKTVSISRCAPHLEKNTGAHYFLLYRYFDKLGKFLKRKPSPRPQYHPKVPFSSSASRRLHCTSQVRRIQEYRCDFQCSYSSALLIILGRRASTAGSPQHGPPPAATVTPQRCHVLPPPAMPKNITFSLLQPGKNGEDGAGAWPTPAHGPGSVYTPIALI